MGVKSGQKMVKKGSKNGQKRDFLKWSKMVKNGQKWSKMVKTNKLNENGQKRVKKGQKHRDLGKKRRVFVTKMMVCHCFSKNGGIKNVSFRGKKDSLSLFFKEIGKIAPPFS